MHSTVFPIAVLVLLFAAAITRAIARLHLVAQPDEWLLAIRNGKLVRAGVGIALWRLPGDVVVRFTSTLQRVAFQVEALSNERLKVTLAGFILWSVSADGEAPFLAFQKLGLANLNAPPRDLRSAKHLLTNGQHHAFQRLLGAALQRLAPHHSLEVLLAQQDVLVDALRGELETLKLLMGIRIDRVELLHVRPADDELLRRMSAAVEARIHDEAADVDRGVRHRELERENALRLTKLGLDREASARAQELESAELTARLERAHREAVARAKTIEVVTSAEERKSQALREHELATLVAEKMGDAMKALPIRDARWVTVGADSPASSLAALITSVIDLTSSRADRGPA